jgi:hypothetical protein
MLDEGYIFSNKFRKIVFEGVASGESNIKNIAKKHRIIQNVAIKVAEDLTKNKYFEKKGNFYILSKDGEKIASIVKG